jgi:MFS family permease
VDAHHLGGQPDVGGGVMGALAQFRSFNRPSRVLMVNQFGINLGFYMLMPYLADYLAGPLGLAAWAVGLVMGVRNFSQQGMFFVGGTLADRFGYKPLIVAGCVVRTGGFALLVVAQSLPSVLIASAATGFAGALFNPAVRAYLAADSGDRTVEAFAMFNIFYQAGILLGPLVGLALLALDFRLTVLGAAAVFAVLTVAQLFALPQHAADPDGALTSILHDWRTVLRNRRFLGFAAAMTGAYVLSFQIYLALPMQSSALAPRHQPLLVAEMFAVSGLVAIAGQLRITRWFAECWEAGRSLVVGAMVLAVSFLPLAVIPNGERFGTAAAVVALLLTASLLAIASAALFPFEMRTVVALSDDRLVATHYGFYSTIVGVGILVGNLAVGSLMGVAHRLNIDEMVWSGLILVGIATVLGLRRLDGGSARRRRSADCLVDEPAVLLGAVRPGGGDLSHSVHDVGERHPAVEVHDHRRAAPAAPEADLAERNIGHRFRFRQCEADTPTRGHAQHQIHAVGLFLEDQVDRFGAEQPEPVDVAPQRDCRQRPHQ